jgi:signal transduction histidine kinase
MILQKNSELLQGSIPSGVIHKIEMFQEDFRFAKVKLFSGQGEVVYSPDPEDLGKIKLQPDILKSLSQGNYYSKSLKKGSISLEGDVVEADIVETYIPLIVNDTFNGAYKMDYDITLRNNAIHNVVFKASLIPFLMMLGGLMLTILVLIQLDKSITKRKMAEEELRAFTEKLQHSNRELESFAHIASHDLQEPLRNIMAFGNRLITKYSDVIDDQGRDYLIRMENASNRMKILINSLLTFSRVSTKAQPFVPVDMKKLTHEVLSDLEVSIEQKSGRVEVGELATIDADPLQMRQLLQNLIVNALKFTQEGVHPVVKIYGRTIHTNGDHKNGYSHEEDLYELSVEDNGIGFDEKYVNRIFDIFQRLHGRQEYEGTGIGLAICRRIVDRHNGEIKAKSVSGEGTQFIFTLPVKQEKGGNNE